MLAWGGDGKLGASDAGEVGEDLSKLDTPRPDSLTASVPENGVASGVG